MNLHGQNLIGFSTSGQGDAAYRGVDPATGQELGTFKDATETELDRAAQLAAEGV